MTFCILCGIQSIVIFKKKGGYILKIITKLYIVCHTQGWYHKFLLKESYNNIGCDEEEVDSDDMEYTEDAIDNMILEFSGD